MHPRALGDNKRTLSGFSHHETVIADNIVMFLSHRAQREVAGRLGLCINKQGTHMSNVQVFGDFRANDIGVGLEEVRVSLAGHSGDLE